MNVFIQVAGILLMSLVIVYSGYMFVSTFWRGKRGKKAEIEHAKKLLEEVGFEIRVAPSKKVSEDKETKEA